MALVDHPHISLFGSTECTCTEEEAKALAVVAGYRVAKVSDRAPFLSPSFKRHRAGFTHIGELWELQGPGGMNDESMRDRENILLELTAKNDKVWGIFRVVGTHTGPLYGIPETGRHIDVIEVGLWRVEDGVIAEAWYFGDELGLLRALALNPPDLTGSE
ncbi:MAG TPA: ester cyclase [Acidimicrobiia bacterium]|nr:ester cyclase [Acidimicrobiia bacterium]